MNCVYCEISPGVVYSKVMGEFLCRECHPLDYWLRWTPMKFVPPERYPSAGEGRRCFYVMCEDGGSPLVSCLRCHLTYCREHMKEGLYFMDHWNGNQVVCHECVSYYMREGYCISRERFPEEQLKR